MRLIMKILTLLITCAAIACAQQIKLCPVDEKGKAGNDCIVIKAAAVASVQLAVDAHTAAAQRERQALKYSTVVEWLEVGIRESVAKALDAYPTPAMAAARAAARAAAEAAKIDAVERAK